MIGVIASPKSSIFGGLGEAIRPRNSGPFVNHRVSLDEITKRYPVPTDDVVKEDVANEDLTLNGSKSMIKSKKEPCKYNPALLLCM